MIVKGLQTVADYQEIKKILKTLMKSSFMTESNLKDLKKRYADANDKISIRLWREVFPQTN